MSVLEGLPTNFDNSTLSVTAGNEKSEKHKDCSHCGGTGLEYHNPDFGKDVRKMRTEHEITLRELANEMGISVGYLSDLESGRRKPSQKLEEDAVSALAAIIQERQ